MVNIYITLFILSFLLYKVLIKVTQLSGHLDYFLAFNVGAEEVTLYATVNTGKIENGMVINDFLLLLFTSHWSYSNIHEPNREIVV